MLGPQMHSPSSLLSSIRFNHVLLSPQVVARQCQRRMLQTAVLGHTGTSLLQADRWSRKQNRANFVLGERSFHSTPQRQGAPFVPFLLAALKSTTALELARTAGRIALTFVPVILLKNHKSRRYLKKHAAIHGKPASEEKTTLLLKRIRHRTILFHILLFTPITLFWATIFASLERTPLTGRWRLIILSPEEEDEICNQLAGPGWYHAINDILSEEGSPPTLPLTDWRYQWVEETLRRLEYTLPVLQKECKEEWLTRGPDDVPLPPPADYPLKPRPRGTEYLRWFCEMSCARTVQPAPHAVPGPPYSLVVVDKPDTSNAFSYGFGPDGGGGVVVYSGFLDEVLSRVPPDSGAIPVVSEETLWWSHIFGSLFSFGVKPRALHPIPTTEQTSELAILLSHELAHLILSHHLETLSSGTVIVPGVISIAADIVRALLFPFTMLFGPFVNDAVAQMGKIGSGELVKLGEYCTSVKQEIEADVVSARLLAHAGFDARHAVKFWEDRQASPNTAECTHRRAEDWENSSAPGEKLVRRIMSSTHPINSIRVDSLKHELFRWQTEKEVTLEWVRTQLLKEQADKAVAGASS